MDQRFYLLLLVFPLSLLAMYLYRSLHRYAGTRRRRVEPRSVVWAILLLVILLVAVALNL